MAIDLQTVLDSNSRLANVKTPLVALFVGATSGIGLGALKEFAQHASDPRVYIVARNAKTAGAIVEELHVLNPRGRYEIIEKNVSLVKDAEAVAEFVKTKESSLDLLFLSVGFVSLDGRQDTTEGLDASMTTRYYSRIRITQLLLPLLRRAKSPHVVSILAGGMEGSLQEDDLDLRQAKNWSVARASVHSATIGTLALERLAAESPRVSFVHAYPGMVATPLFDRLASGIAGFILRCFLAPVIRLFSRSATEAGQRGLFLATSARYSVDDGIVPLGAVVTGGSLQKGVRSNGGKGIFLVGASGDIADNEKVLMPLRKRDMEKKVWEHTEAVFDSVR
ncbi:hypothetical protein PG993_012509 [Apiospora rasikravindrae]|uniref:Uncharacterized protein n=1 Tax=Apiospora rasikravindrae TaxID=990691 RepID=A0ABR1S330_9PEZI